MTNCIKSLIFGELKKLVSETIPSNKIKKENIANV